MPFDIENISDTLTQAENIFNPNDAPTTPESQAYVVSDSEITIRKIVRVLFFSGVLLLAGTIIYLKVKKK